MTWNLMAVLTKLPLICARNDMKFSWESMSHFLQGNYLLFNNDCQHVDDISPDHTIQLEREHRFQSLSTIIIWMFLFLPFTTSVKFLWWCFSIEIKFSSDVSSSPIWAWAEVGRLQARTVITIIIFIVLVKNYDSSSKRLISLILL